MRERMYIIVKTQLRVAWPFLMMVIFGIVKTKASQRVV